MDKVKLKVFHGLDRPVITPDLSYCSKYSDFGQGFYVTNNRKQAIDWGSKRTTGSTFAVSCFELTFDKSLSIKEFEKPDIEWLELIIRGRNGEHLPYDIIIGPVADDNVRKALDIYADMNLPITEEEKAKNNSQFAEDFKREVIKMLKVNDTYSQVALLNNKALEHLQYKSFAIYDAKTREVLPKSNNYRPKGKGGRDGRE